VSFAFQPHRGLILVQAELKGPAGTGILSLALDTGATATTVNQSRLMQLGYDPAGTTDRFQVTTGSGIEFVARITVEKVAALGQERAGFPVLCHTLPPSAGVDGLLGLDFLRGQILTVDFRNGRLTLR
jgi:predicted aspartyl protease